MRVPPLLSRKHPRIEEQLNNQIGKNDPFFFLLRAFKDDRMEKGVWHDHSRRYFTRRNLTTSEVVVKCLACIAPTVQLGKSRRRSVICLHTTKDRWREDARYLMKKSKAILLQVGLGDSVVEEADLIKADSKLAEKTFIIVDPDRYKDTTLTEHVLANEPWYMFPLLITANIMNPGPALIRVLMDVKHRDHGYDEWDKIIANFESINKDLPRDFVNGIIYSLVKPKISLKLDDVSSPKLEIFYKKQVLFEILNHVA